MAKKSETISGKDPLMLDKDAIMKAIEESQYVKKDYPAFWKFYEMLLEMNNDMSALQDAMEAKNGKGKTSNKR